jgi:RES domain-containing protein
MSGAGAAIRGARFNIAGMEALYLALDPITAIKEANQGLVHKIEPCVLCSYEVDCDDIADLGTDEGRRSHAVEWTDMACAWFSFIAAGKEPPSWAVVRRLRAEKVAGILVPSFAPGATENDRNLVLWQWGESPPHRVNVFDPSGKLPKDQLSWR